MNLQELHKEYLEHKTIKDCDALAAVKQDGFALRLVQNQTDEICLAAVNEDGYSLRFVQNQTEEICLAAVNENGCALKYVQNQTDEICLAAVKRDGGALLYVNPAIFKNMTQDLTVEEVSEKLGYNVRIIK